MLNVSTRQFIQDHLESDLHRLLLSAKQYPDVDVPQAVAQIQAFRKVQGKIPAWFRIDLIMPPVLSVEQASSEKTALFKAQLFSGKTALDLTGGMGIDSWAFSRRFEQLAYIERNPELIRIAEHNFDVLGVKNINTLAADAEKFLLENTSVFDLIYLDPGRRDAQQGRVFRLEDCQPNILEIKDLLLKKAKRVLLKTAPMLDLLQVVDQLASVTQIWVVSVDGECKEVLYLLENKVIPEAEIPIEAVCLGDEVQVFRFTRGEEHAAQVSYSPPLRYLYEPDAAILKAGAFQAFASRFGLLKLHRHTHLYTSDTFFPKIPGRVFIVEALLKYNRKEVQKAIPEGRANVATRNFSDSVAQMRKKLGLRDGGDLFVFGITDHTNRKVLLSCRRILDNPG